jgi:hypothetical protein
VTKPVDLEDLRHVEEAMKTGWYEVYGDPIITRTLTLLIREKRASLTTVPRCLAESPTGLLYCLLDRYHEGDHEDLKSGANGVRWARSSA